jgi:transposase-like protein
MAGSKAPNKRATRRRWPLSEKRRIVELTLRAGASIGAIAREQAVHPTSLCHWKALYRAGKLNAQPEPRVSIAAPGATFLPVTIAGAGRARRSASGALGALSVVQLVLASGASMRIETGGLDAALVCALIAELRR